MLITERGIMMRTRVTEIRETGRNAAGGKLIRVDEGDKLVAMAKVEADDDETIKPGAAPTGEAPAGEPPATDVPPPADTPPSADAGSDGDAT